MSNILQNRQLINTRKHKLLVEHWKGATGLPFRRHTIRMVRLGLVQVMVMVRVRAKVRVGSAFRNGGLELEGHPACDKSHWSTFPKFILTENNSGKIGQLVVAYNVHCNGCLLGLLCGSGEAHLDIELFLAAVFNAVQPDDWSSWVRSSFLLCFCFFGSLGSVKGCDAVGSATGHHHHHHQKQFVVCHLQIKEQLCITSSVKPEVND